MMQKLQGTTSGLALRTPARATDLRLEPGSKHVLLRPRPGCRFPGHRKQRSALACARVKGAGPVQPDEPLATLDDKRCHDARPEPRKIRADCGAILVHAPSEREEVRMLDGIIATLWAGRVTQFDQQSDANLHDPCIDASDPFGTHGCDDQMCNPIDRRGGKAVLVCLPSPDMTDFNGLKSATASNRNLCLPSDRQVANPGRFRRARFPDTRTKEDARARSGRVPGGPVNRLVCEDIAEVFTGCDMSRIGNPAKVSGSMDHGRTGPSLGLRDADAWLSMVGMGKVGKQICLLVDERGPRRDQNDRPVGVCVARRGVTNDAAAAHAGVRAIDGLQGHAPPQVVGMGFGEANLAPVQGEIAHQICRFTVFAAHTVKPGVPVMNDNGTPTWPMVPPSRRACWQEGSKFGYQRVRSRTLMTSIPGERASGCSGQARCARSAKLFKEFCQGFFAKSLVPSPSLVALYATQEHPRCRIF